MTERERIIVFGGTFDPPHRAHVVLPQLVAKRLGASRIIYVLNASNPLKEQEPTAAIHRLAMLKLALQEVPEAEISTIELSRPAPSYTVDTLTELREELPTNADLFLLIGADASLSFSRWRDPERILKLATPAVMLRPPWDRASFREQLLRQMSAKEVERWMDWTIPVPRMEMSASEIRRRLNAGESLADMLHPAVIDYIRRHDLYSEETDRVLR